MIDPQKLLGGLLETATQQGLKAGKKAKKGLMGKGGLGGLLDANKGAIGMGLLGLAIGAFEHFTQNKASGSPSNLFGGSQPPPPPPPPQSSNLPPIPVSPGTPPPPPPGAPQSSASENDENSLLLLQAMIAAANADYSIDETEKSQILERMDQANLNSEEKNFILNEFDHPLGISDLAARVKSLEMAEQVYAVSLIATGADTDVEKNYLRNLAKRLNLPEEVTHKWHEQLEMNVS